MKIFQFPILVIVDIDFNASSFCSDKIFFVLDKTEIVQDKILVQG